MLIVLFGSDSPIGTYLRAYLSFTGYTVSCVPQDGFDVSKFSSEIILVDLIQTRLRENEEADPVVINSLQLREGDEDDLYLVNTTFSIELAQACSSNCWQLIHLTTPDVFQRNTIGRYDEYDVKDSIESYGNSRARGEPFGAMVIRCDVLCGELSPSTKKESWETIVPHVVGRKEAGIVKGYTNRFWNGITALELAKTIRTFLIQGIEWHGVKHIVPSYDTSHYSLCKMINEQYQLDIHLHPTTSAFENRFLTSKSGIESRKMYISMPFELYLPNLEEQLSHLRNFDKQIKGTPRSLACSLPSRLQSEKEEE